MKSDSDPGAKRLVMSDVSNASSAEKGKSLFTVMGLPPEFGKYVLLLALIMLLSPYVGGADFGIFKVPSFPAAMNSTLHVLGPIGMAIAIFLFLPLWSRPPIVTKRKLKTLIKQLKHPAASRRREAALDLGKLGRAAQVAIPDLIEALNDSDPYVRENAAKALEAGGADAVRALVVALRHQKGLAITGETPMIPRPVPRLSEVIGEDDVRGALVEIGTAAVPALTHALHESAPALKAPIAAALKRIQSAKLDDTITQALSDGDNEIRLSGAIALAESASPADVPALTALLQDSYIKIRVVAIGGLGKSRSREAIASLAKVLNAEKDSRVRYEAVRALRQLADHNHEAIPPLVGALKDPTLLVQLAAVAELGEIGPPAKAAIPALTEALSHHYEDIRKAAAIALDRIRGNG